MNNPLSDTIYGLDKFHPSLPPGTDTKPTNYLIWHDEFSLRSKPALYQWWENSDILGYWVKIGIR